MRSNRPVTQGNEFRRQSAPAGPTWLLAFRRGFGGTSAGGIVTGAARRVLSILLAQGAPAPAGQSIALLGDTVRLGVAWPAGQAVVDAPEEPTTTVKGDDSAVLLFALGRLALGDAQLGVSGDHDLAAQFKHYVPGP